ncbi:MAG: glycosyltransferase [Azoarcus sp.]|jgi:glycosyltransferase involved in cell wall biosynthesis|nr:glycosyltransferase [Azoarcus sp.]
MSKSSRAILQVCYGYQSPFTDCARQYARLFRDTPYKVVTVQLKDDRDEEAARKMGSDEVIFLGYQRSEIRNLKLKAIRDIRRIAATQDFAFCIAHRHQSIYTALFGTDLMVIGVNHAFHEYRRFCRRLYTNAFRKRLRLLGISDAVRDSIRAALPAWPHSHIETLYNRIDVAAAQADLLPREAARARLGLPEQGWIVGNAGRLHPDKDHPTLIRAFAAALPSLPPGSLLAIMGSGLLENTLQALAGELGIRESVRFLGQVDEGRRYFKAFDVFALSSDREPFGMVLLEALAAHLPVVCSDCGGGREVVEGIGDLFPFGDVDALARILVRLSQWRETEDYARKAQAHLQQKFSDEAAAEAFWRLPMLEQYKPC